MWYISEMIKQQLYFNILKYYLVNAQINDSHELQNILGVSSIYLRKINITTIINDSNWEKFIIVVRL